MSTETANNTPIPAENVAIGALITDERFSYYMRVGHITVGPKWVTFRSFHPEANVYPNAPVRIRRGDSVKVAS